MNTIKVLLVFGLLGMTPWLVETTLSNLWLLPAVIAAGAAVVWRAPSWS